MEKKNIVRGQSVSIRKGRKKALAISKLIAACSLEKSVKITKNGKEMKGCHIVIRVKDPNKIRRIIKNPETQQPEWGKGSFVVNLPVAQRELVLNLLKTKKGAKSRVQLQIPEWKE